MRTCRSNSSTNSSGETSYASATSRSVQNFCRKQPMHSGLPCTKIVKALGQVFSTYSTVISGWRRVTVSIIAPKILQIEISLFAQAQITAKILQKVFRHRTHKEKETFPMLSAISGAKTFNKKTRGIRVPSGFFSASYWSDPSEIFTNSCGLRINTRSRPASTKPRFPHSDNTRLTV